MPHVRAATAALGQAYDNYLIDTTSRVIVGVEATPARFSQETMAARKMVERVEKLGIRAEELAADKAYGSGEFLAWLLERGIQPHIPVIDRRHQTDGHFTHDQFRYEPAENAYYIAIGALGKRIVEGLYCVVYGGAAGLEDLLFDAGMPAVEEEPERQRFTNALIQFWLACANDTVQEKYRGECSLHGSALCPLFPWHAPRRRRYLSRSPDGKRKAQPCCFR